MAHKSFVSIVTRSLIFCSNKSITITQKPIPYFIRNVRGFPNQSSDMERRCEPERQNFQPKIMETDGQKDYVDALSSQIDKEFLDTIAPPIPKSFNLAAYVNKSKTLRKLTQMGVNLHVIEMKGHGQYYAELDFEKDVKHIIVFLNSLGVDSNELGNIITKNPTIFQNSIDNMDKRIEYFRSKKFSKDSISRIVTINPRILNMLVIAIDQQLGYYQKLFKLNGNEIRFVITKQPNLLTTKFFHIQEMTMLIKEELGFLKEETKELFLLKPKLWILSRRNLTERLDYIHNVMGIAHKDILKFPGCLLRRKFLVQQRHEYLKTLNKAQYERTKPGYVSLQALVTGTDVNFCQEVTKTSVQDFNEFLRTL